MGWRGMFHILLQQNSEAKETKKLLQLRGLLRFTNKYGPLTMHMGN